MWPCFLCAILLSSFVNLAEPFFAFWVTLLYNTNMKVIKTILKVLLIIILLAIVIIAGLLGYATYTEFYPDEEESLTIFGWDYFGQATSDQPESVDAVELYTGTKPKVGYAFNIMTWNIGYGGLGDDADYFLDGGKNTRSSDEDRVNSNLANIISQIKYQHPNIILLQEVDADSDRSYNINEANRITSNIEGRIYTFAKNYVAPFIPYPNPPIGKVEAGLLTISDYEISEATRVQLPVTFSWPLRLMNLKRCLAVHRLPVEGSDKELVIINLHLEAYDDGEGKLAQDLMLDTYIQNEIDQGNYVIAGGDFNQVFSSVDTSKYPEVNNLWTQPLMDEADFDPSLQFVMDDSVPTCRSLYKPYAGEDHDPSKFQYYMLDGFIVSSNIQIVSCETKDLGFQYSDHNPVFMRVKLLK